MVDISKSYACATSIHWRALGRDRILIRFNVGAQTRRQGGWMEQGRRTLLGLALLGGMSRVLAAPPKTAATPASKLDAELAAIASDPACQLASLSVLAVRHGKIAYERQFGQRFIGAAGL